MQLEEQESGELNVLNKMLTQKSKKVLRVNAGGNSGMPFRKSKHQAQQSEPTNGRDCISNGASREGSIPSQGIVAKSLKAAGGI